MKNSSLFILAMLFVFAQAFSQVNPTQIVNEVSTSVMPDNKIPRQYYGVVTGTNPKEKTMTVLINWDDIIPLQSSRTKLPKNIEMGGKVASRIGTIISFTEQPNFPIYNNCEECASNCPVDVGVCFFDGGQHCRCVLYTLDLMRISDGTYLGCTSKGGDHVIVSTCASCGKNETCGKVTFATFGTVPPKNISEDIKQADLTPPALNILNLNAALKKNPRNKNTLYFKQSIKGDIEYLANPSDCPPGSFLLEIKIGPQLSNTIAIKKGRG